MSVIIGEKPDQAARQSALQANDNTELAATTPFSVSLWVYFDQPPGASETHPLLWYGDTGAQNQYLVVEATKNILGGIDIEARLRGSAGSVSATATQLTAGAWRMLTVNVEETGGASYKVTIFVDDAQADTGSANVGTVSTGDYDRFLLGFAQGGTDFARFRAEHVAVWEKNGDDEPLTASEIETLYDERLAPFDAGDSSGISTGRRCPRRPALRE